MLYFFLEKIEIMMKILGSRGNLTSSMLLEWFQIMKSQSSTVNSTAFNGSFHQSPKADNLKHTGKQPRVRSINANDFKPS